MSKILVTGADGFIGSHLTEQLVRDGNHVVAMVQYNSFDSWGWLDDLSREILDEIEVISGDIRDPDFVHGHTNGVEAIAHLAALIAIPYSYKSPSQYIETNINGTLNVLRAALAIDAKVVQTSTSEVYGSAQSVPINEKHPLVGQSPYSASKIGADQLAYSFFASFGLRVNILRPFNTYGPRQSNRAVIPTIITQLLAGEQSLQLGNLEATRDFNYIDDTVNGFKLALRADNCYGETVNIGSGFEISIFELGQIISDITGRELNIASDKNRFRPDKSEVNRLIACNKKAKDLLGWSPSVEGRTGLKQGLKKTIKWFSNENNLKKYRANQYTI